MTRLDDTIIGAMALKVAEIRYIVASSSHRRNGLAQLLIKAAAPTFRRYRQLCAQVKPENSAAKRAIEKARFVHNPWSDKDHQAG